MKALKIEDKNIYSLLFAAVDTASHQHGLEARTVRVWQIWRYVAKGQTGVKVAGWSF